MASRTQKRSAAKKKAPARRSASKGGTFKSKASKKMKVQIFSKRRSASTAPVVYQTLRERVDAVDTNVGSTENLSDFLESAGW